MNAQVNEAHQKLIADSEARAVDHTWRAERDELRAQVFNLEAEVATLTAERDQLRAALALGQINCDAQYDDLRTERDAARARAERAEAELTTERKKVRVLHKALKNIKNSICRIVPDGYSQPVVDESADECDRIIDAAMKEGAK